MKTIDFEGRERLIRAVDEAVRHNSDDQATDRIRRVLCRFIRDGVFRLPDCCDVSTGEDYARRLLYKSDALGYSIMAMTWGPGQGTPLHDHSNMWCVEGVCRGELEVVQYELLERRGDRYRMESRSSIQAGPGSAGSLIPPHEYHTIANAGNSECAVSLHVYSGEMTHCNTFLPVGANWYQRQSRELHYNAA